MESPLLKDLKALWMWHLGTRAKGGLGSAGRTGWTQILERFSNLSDSHLQWYSDSGLQVQEGIPVCVGLQEEGPGCAWCL